MPNLTSGLCAQLAHCSLNPFLRDACWAAKPKTNRSSAAIVLGNLGHKREVVRMAAPLEHDLLDMLGAQISFG